MSENIQKIRKFIKNFADWFELKPRLDSARYNANFSEREVWNCHLGVNIGFEVDGKNQDFLRPVLVFKKLSKETFIGIPLTTKLKNGSWYYPSKIKEKEGRFIFSQIKVLDSKRLYNRLEKLDTSDFQQLKTAFVSFIK